MAVYEILPPDATLRNPLDPVIFLAGPIQGAPNWQKTALEWFSKHADSHDTICVANPKRPRLGSNFVYKEQVDWEKKHIMHASQNGVLIFYFAAQDPNEPYEQGRAYAQTSRIEIGRVFGWHDQGSDLKIAIGFDHKYVGGSRRYIETMAAEKGWAVHESLEATCAEAYRLYKNI